MFILMAKDLHIPLIICQKFLKNLRGFFINVSNYLFIRNMLTMRLGTTLGIWL